MLSLRSVRSITTGTSTSCTANSSRRVRTSSHRSRHTALIIRLDRVQSFAASAIAEHSQSANLACPEQARRRSIWLTRRSALRRDCRTRGAQSGSRASCWRDDKLTTRPTVVDSSLRRARPRLSRRRAWTRRRHVGYVGVICHREHDARPARRPRRGLPIRTIRPWVSGSTEDRRSPKWSLHILYRLWPVSYCTHIALVRETTVLPTRARVPLVDLKHSSRLRCRPPHHWR